MEVDAGFYNQPTEDVARQLIGKIIVSTKGGERTSGRIVETEAYLGNADRASHAYRGPSARNDVMFGPPGHIYVYFIYGMHYCMNIVTREAGVGEAVLIRALEPLEGIDVMTDRRGGHSLINLCNGPAKLVEAIGVTKADNGIALDAPGELWLEDDGVTPSINTGPRIGISRDTDLPLRFWATASGYVSKKESGRVQ